MSLTRIANYSNWDDQELYGDLKSFYHDLLFQVQRRPQECIDFLFGALEHHSLATPILKNRIPEILDTLQKILDIDITAYLRNGPLDSLSKILYRIRMQLNNMRYILTRGIRDLTNIDYKNYFQEPKIVRLNSYVQELKNLEYQSFELEGRTRDISNPSI